MKRRTLLSLLGLVLFGTGLNAQPPHPGGAPGDLAGTYIATLPERAEILQLHRDGTAEMTLSDQVTFGAEGFTFSDSLGSWKRSGPRRVVARMVNLNFDVTGPPTYTGAAVVDYVLEFGPHFRTFAASCQGKIFATGQDPFDPNSTPFATFDCAYLNGFLYQRVPLL
jgi:hypothetical protein